MVKHEPDFMWLWPNCSLDIDLLVGVDLTLLKMFLKKLQPCKHNAIINRYYYSTLAAGSKNAKKLDIINSVRVTYAFYCTQFDHSLHRPRAYDYSHIDFFLQLCRMSVKERKINFTYCDGWYFRVIRNHRTKFDIDSPVKPDSKCGFVRRKPA